MAKLNTYTTALGNTFNHANSKLSTRDASGVVGEYNFTLNVTGDALSLIQRTNPEVTNKVALREYFNSLIGFVPPVKTPVVAVVPNAQAVNVPALAIADASKVVVPKIAVPKVEINKQLMAYIDASHKAGIKLFDIKEAIVQSGNTPELANAHMAEFEKTL